MANVPISNMLKTSPQGTAGLQKKSTKTTTTAFQGQIHVVVCIGNDLDLQFSSKPNHNKS